ncbi:hypothetical protein AB0H71_02760 [Nocardia sp. NPDC050697]|uniref:hypothetical protein n=1 Tax=Nocardia sp. NPDC050697 TaxID=3155158 RepID=UPI0033EC9B17
MRIPGRTGAGGDRFRPSHDGLSETVRRLSRFGVVALAVLLMSTMMAATGSALPPDTVTVRAPLPSASAVPVPDEHCTATTCDSTDETEKDPGTYPGCRTGVGPCPYTDPCLRNPDAPACMTDPCTASNPPSTCGTPPSCTEANPPPTCPRDPDTTVPCEPGVPQCPPGNDTSNPGNTQPDPGPGDPVTSDPGTRNPQSGSPEQHDPGSDIGPPDTGQPPVSEDRKPPGSVEMALTPSAIAPGGEVTASGRGCEPGARVELKIGATPVGTTVAAADGSFTAPLTLAAIEVGRHDVQTWCGRPLTAQLDVVLVSSVDGGASTVAILLFFLLLGGWFYGHRLISHRSTRRSR